MTNHTKNKKEKFLYFLGKSLKSQEQRDARDATVAANLVVYCQQIRRQYEYLSADHIDQFIIVVNRTMDRDMISTYYAGQPWFYEQTPQQAVVDDIQILFVGHFLVQNSVGHYICVHFKAQEQKVFIYDSLYAGRRSHEIDNLNSIHQANHITDPIRNIIRRRYLLHREIVFVKPRTKQPDYKSCGVFAIAYATTLLLGNDPAEVALKLGNSRNVRNPDPTTDLRYHLVDMIQQERISLFPSSI